MSEPHWVKSREKVLDHMVHDSRLREQQRTKIQTFIDEWLRDFSVNSKLVCAQAIRDFGLFLKKPYEETTKDDVKAFLDQASKKHSPGGIRNYVRRLKPFYKWLLGDGDRYPDCMKWVNGNITRTKGERILASVREKIVGEEGYRMLITMLKSSRDKALVSTIWDTGARASEVLEMRVGDVIDLHGDRPAVIVGGGKRRIPLIHDSVAYLISWLNVHPAPGDANAPLWPARVDRSSDDSGMLGYKGLQNLASKSMQERRTASDYRSYVPPHKGLLPCEEQCLSLRNE